MNSLQLATQFLETKLNGKYIHLEKILPLLKTYENVFEISIIGKSVQQRNIFQVKIGTGKTKILLWSQMHGNEPTTTKGLFDFFKFLAVDSLLAKQIKNNYTLICIPMLNPDGAFAYTRENANGIDLNRDAFNATQPEMKVLRAIYDDFKPNFCFNMHDQRTIFGTDGYNLPATISFLAPAFNEKREYNDIRLKAITVINKVFDELNYFLPNQIGRFDDSYNINCTGDYFTTQNTPTILFEAGFFQNDYNREESRKFVFIALLSSFSNIYENVVVDNELHNYLRIPQNNDKYFDFIYKNVKIIQNNIEKIINFAAQYSEVLINNEIHFIAKISKIEDLENYFGHQTYDCKSMLFSSNGLNYPQIGNNADFCLNNLLKFSNGLKIIK
jgi:hypothetical protein